MLSLLLEVSSSRNEPSDDSSGDDMEITPEKNGISLDKEDKEARKERKRLKREEKEKRREERRRKKLLKSQGQDRLVCNIVEGNFASFRMNQFVKFIF